MKYTFLIPATFLLLILSAFTTVDPQPITIFTIGDSTMADYNTQRIRKVIRTDKEDGHKCYPVS